MHLDKKSTADAQTECSKTQYLCRGDVFLMLNNCCKKYMYFNLNRIHSTTNLAMQLA